MVQSLETPTEELRISVHLDEARRRKGIRSWAEVARLGGLRPSPLSQLVRGKVRLSNVRLGTLLKLAAVLDVGLDELVDVERIPRVPSPPRPRADRVMSEEEFAAAVTAVLRTALPEGWVGPAEDDLDEITPASATDLASRLRGQDTLEQRFGLR